MPTSLRAATGFTDRRDLFNAIRDGDHPRWTLKWQGLMLTRTPDYHLHPFDLTKVWPHADYPADRGRKLTLDRKIRPNFIPSIRAALHLKPNNLVRVLGFADKNALAARLCLFRCASRPSRVITADPVMRKARYSY